MKRCRGGIIKGFFGEKYGSRTKEFDEMPRFPNKDCPENKKNRVLKTQLFFVLSSGSRAIRTLDQRIKSPLLYDRANDPTNSKFDTSSLMLSTILSGVETAFHFIRLFFRMKLTRSVSMHPTRRTRPTVKRKSGYAPNALPAFSHR